MHRWGKIQSRESISESIQILDLTGKDFKEVTINVQRIKGNQAERTKGKHGNDSLNREAEII